MDLLKETEFTCCKPAITPIDSKLKLDMEGEALNNVIYSQRLVGKLTYLTITRPNITYDVSLVSQFMYAPIVKHSNLVKRILRHLIGLIDRGILMRNNIHANTDDNWAGSFINRKSTTSYCTFVGGNIVTWKRKKQPIVA